MTSGSVDVAVLGAGAAGFLAAIRAASRGRRVLLLEKNRKPGVKILISGGTRCNLTNDSPAESLAAEFGPASAFVLPSLRAFDSRATVQFFERAGVATKVEGEGKVFPRSNRATDVVAVLVKALEDGGATLALEQPALSLSRGGGGAFAIETPRGAVVARRVVVTTGGASYAKTGATGDGYAFARSFGHRIVTPRPALVALIVDVPWVRALSGLTLPSVRVSVQSGKRRLAERRRGFLFTHFGLSGPAVMDVSRAVTELEARGRLEGPGAPRLALDFVPDLAEEAVDAAIRDAASRDGAQRVGSALPGRLPERLVEALLQASDVPGSRRAAELTRDERRRLVATLKVTELPIAGTRGFDRAEVTAGGVDLREIDPHTLESKFVPGLFFAGEVLDVDGPIGGFNFQAAFATGFAAGGCA